MPNASIQYVLLAMLAIGLLFAAFTDIRSRQIANWLNAAIALCAPLFWWASGIALWPDVGIQLGVAAATFAVLAVLFAFRAMGGGDVKLLTALALWIPPAQFLSLLIVMALVGGVLTLVIGSWHIARHRRDRLAIPYGVAIAAGGLWVLVANYLDPARATFGASLG
ncbi:MAG: prepilin peptidase [Novosphingobium sp.]|nr:prepilin peptidase [Novosphingobium sp.]MBO9601672.1 prepilin peptidase [Novosphingobium sp.]